MDGIHRSLRSLIPSASDARRAIVVGCAVFVAVCHYLPCAPDVRVVSIAPANFASADKQPADASTANRRQFLVPADSQQLGRLQRLAVAERQRIPSPKSPEYYAERWRIAASQYYYEQDLLQERNAAASEDDAPGTEPAGRSDSANKIAPVAFQVRVPQTTEPQRFGASYWHQQRSQAEMRLQTLWATLPAGAGSQPPPKIVLGARLPGRPRFLGLVVAGVLACLVGAGLLVVPSLERRRCGSPACAPSMQLTLPVEWVRYSPTLGQRLVRTLGYVAWSFLSGYALFWLAG